MDRAGYVAPVHVNVDNALTVIFVQNIQLDIILAVCTGKSGLGRSPVTDLTFDQAAARGIGIVLNGIAAIASAT